ncbi:MAG: Beta-galactosidase trimerization domain protein [bacterium ADurb.Bin429]|nr:MAG: Beta-galactosidase trimerization domain protein [bacterium ADurb.Bin429]
MIHLPFRQIHLDFHTSEAIPGVGSEWDKAHFQRMLQLGHVNSINIFGKCHHGWSYYPTKIEGCAMHPTLTFDLLGAMIEACHEIGVKCPVYISVGLDEKLARKHAEWLRRQPDGSTSWVGWMQPGYHEICLRTPYLDNVIAQTEEVCHLYNPDGLWLDIVGPKACCCQTCIAEMINRGWDPRDAAKQQELGRETYVNYARRINAAIHAITPAALIFHNHGHVIRGDRELACLNTHIELESLPTGGWGYDHFPLSARYVHGLDRDYLGMTGKFHTFWGEFGGYKHPNALRYEAALALANGAKMCVGDQMHPYGKLDEATYRLIGEAYTEIEPKEPWCEKVTSVADVGVLSIEGFTRTSSLHDTGSLARLVDPGAVRALQEGGILFDVIDTESDFGKYKVVILPDAIPVDDALKARLQAYLRAGGKIFASGTSVLDADKGEFVLDFGVKYLGKAESNPTYLCPRFDLAPWAPASHVIYTEMYDIVATSGEILADRQDSFFNRDYLHFCSHQHAPCTLKDAAPAMVRTANTVYLAFEAFTQYAKMGQNPLREIILHGIRTLLDEPTLVTNLPAQGVQTVMWQAEKDRSIVHLVYGVPVKRGQGIEVVEDLTPVHDIIIALRVQQAPKRVYLAPQNTDLPYTVEDGMLKATVPTVQCHQMVVIE